MTFTLSDGTSTITFSAITTILRRLDSDNFNPIPYPKNEGREVIFEGQYNRVFGVTAQFKDIPAGDTAAVQRDALETLILSGGVNEYKFTLTFDREDGVSVNYSGYVRNYKCQSVAGSNTSVITVTFEFWEDNTD